MMATSNIALADDFTDPICPAATPIGRALDRTLSQKPVATADVTKIERQLSDAYGMCAGEYKLNNLVDGYHWALFREAKLHLLVGDAELDAKNLKAAREDYQAAFDRADEIARYQSDTLQTSGDNRPGSYHASHGMFNRSKFSDLAAQLRDIAQKALAALPKS